MKLKIKRLYLVVDREGRTADFIDVYTTKREALRDQRDLNAWRQRFRRPWRIVEFVPKEPTK